MRPNISFHPAGSLFLHPVTSQGFVWFELRDTATPDIAGPACHCRGIPFDQASIACGAFNAALGQVEARDAERRENRGRPMMAAE